MWIHVKLCMCCVRWSWWYRRKWIARCVYLYWAIRTLFICAIFTNIWFIVKSLYPPSGAPGAAGRQGPPGEKGAKGSAGEQTQTWHNTNHFIVRTGREQTCDRQKSVAGNQQITNGQSPIQVASILYMSTICIQFNIRQSYIFNRDVLAINTKKI